jgi:Peptidase family S51
VICLQGGREFATECNEMDAEVLQLTGPGSVAVLAGAARPGSDYADASRRARRHYEALGAGVVVVPDPRIDVGATIAALTEDISLLVLPGGSPASLRKVLSGSVEQRLVEMHASGIAISGASAGAMVLCTRMVQPGGRAEVIDGLGLVDGLALPHWSPGSDRGWPVSDDLDLWGLPECGGVVIVDGLPRAVGQGEPAHRRGGEWRAVARTLDGGERSPPVR